MPGDNVPDATPDAGEQAALLGRLRAEYERLSGSASAERAEPLSCEPLPRIPPSHYLALLISDLLTIKTDTVLERVCAKNTANQAARVIATFCSPRSSR